MKVGILLYHKNINKIYKKEWIEECINSILGQSYRDYSVYDLNYGSDDFNFSDHFQDKVYKSFNKEFKNHADAMNFLLDRCVEDDLDAVFNINLDDYYHEDRFIIQLGKIKEGYDLVSSNFQYIRGSELSETFRFDKVDIQKELESDLVNVIAHPCVCYSKEFIKSNRYISDEIPREDLNLWKRTISDFKFFICEKILLYYRIHDNQITSTKISDQTSDIVDKSLCILLTTIGKPELRNMLDSLKSQLNSNDYLYVVIDGQQYFESAKRIIESYKPNFPCKFIEIYNNENLGYWGHPLRNKYQSNLNGDYILHCDDDDIYIKNSLGKVRQHIKGSDSKSIYFFKFYRNFNKKELYWVDEILRDGNVGTPCGVIPNIPSKMGIWTNRYGGDYDFYSTCKFDHKFVDEIIYCADPKTNGYPIEVDNNITIFEIKRNIINVCRCGEPINKRLSNFCQKCNKLY